MEKGKGRLENNRRILRTRLIPPENYPQDEPPLQSMCGRIGKTFDPF